MAVDFSVSTAPLMALGMLGLAALILRGIRRRLS
jgi:hypothetical protein